LPLPRKCATILARAAQASQKIMISIRLQGDYNNRGRIVNAPE
jgi:hypothetical protein